MGATAAAAGETTPESSTWRWRVSAILDEHRADGGIFAPANALVFYQRYERYSALGLPEASEKSR